MTLVAGKRRCLLMTGDDDEVHDKKPQRYAVDNRAAFNCTQWYTCSLSNNNKRLRSRYYTVEANYWRTQSIARPLRNSRATCYVSHPVVSCVKSPKYGRLNNATLGISSLPISQYKWFSTDSLVRRSFHDTPSIFLQHHISNAFSQIASLFLGASTFISFCSIVNLESISSWVTVVAP